MYVTISRTTFTSVRCQADLFCWQVVYLNFNEFKIKSFSISCFFFFSLWQSHYNYTLFKMLDITSALNVSSLSKSITLTLKTWLCFWMTPFCLLYLHLHWETWKHFQISIFFFLTSDVQSVFKLPSNPSSLTGRFYITDLTTGILHNR